MAEQPTIAGGYSAAWRLRNERGLSERERIALVSEAVMDLAEEQGVSAAQIKLRAAESFILASTWEDGR